MKKSKKIYLSGCMEYYAQNKRDAEASNWRKKVKVYFDRRGLDFNCIDPMVFYNIGSDYPTNGFEVMRFDFRKVEEADVILVNLRDIRKSLGTSDEILYAYLLGKPVIGFIEDFVGNPEDIEAYVHNFKYNQIDRIEIGENALVNACEYIQDYYF